MNENFKLATQLNQSKTFAFEYLSRCLCCASLLFNSLIIGSTLGDAHSLGVRLPCAPYSLTIKSCQLADFAESEIIIKVSAT